MVHRPWTTVIKVGENILVIGDQFHEYITLSFWRRSRCQNQIWTIYHCFWEKEFTKLVPITFSWNFFFHKFLKIYHRKKLARLYFLAWGRKLSKTRYLPMSSSLQISGKPSMKKRLQKLPDFRKCSMGMIKMMKVTGIYLSRKNELLL